MAENYDVLLRELWRVIMPNGRLLIIMPNRRGLWARAEQTPFGFGRPFSSNEINKILSGAMFEAISRSNILYTPPWSYLIKTSPLWEKIGRHLCPSFAGLLVIEARKSLYSISPSKPKYSKKQQVIAGNIL